MVPTLLRSQALAGFLALAIAAPAAAQPLDVVPRGLYTERSGQEGNRIVFCVNPTGLMAGFERDLVDALGLALLTETEIHEVPEAAFQSMPLPLDYRIVLTEEQFYILLAQECDAFMGFLLSPANPDWLTVTRPYLSASTVLVTREDVDALEDLPYGERIGARMMAAGDNNLIQFLRAQPDSAKWRRTPYPHNRLLLERLDDGTLGAALIWSPGLYAATDGDPEAAGYTVIENLPFPVDPIEIGIATRTENTYLNTILSDAIAVLVADGTIDTLLAEHGLTGAED